MSNILVKFSADSGVKGDGEEGAVTCFAMRHIIYLPVVRAQSRVQAGADHGPIALIHAVDRASPILKQKALEGADLGEVQINRMRLIEGASKKVEIITLGSAKISRIDVDTPYSSSLLLPGEEMIETLYLEYSSIRWDAKRIVGETVTNVEGVISSV